MVQRYSDELTQPLRETAWALDQVRVQLLNRQQRTAVSPVLHHVSQSFTSSGTEKYAFALTPF